MAKVNGTGQGGKSMQDREIASKVRQLSLQRIAEILERPAVQMSREDYELYKAILIKLAGTVLPRLNEHSGPEGTPIPISNVFVNDLPSNNGDTKDSQA